MKTISFCIILILLSYEEFIDAKDQVKIAYYENFYPLSFSKNNQMKGVLVDSAKFILEKKMHYKVISEGFPWARAQEFVKKGEYDAHVTAYTEERSKFLLFNKTPVYTSYLVIIYSINNPKKDDIVKIKSKDDMKKFIVNDYIGNATKNEHYPEKEGFKIDLSANIENAFKKLTKNRGDIIITNNSIANILTNKKTRKDLRQIKIDFLSPRIDLLFCIRKSYPDAEKIINNFEKNLQVALKNKELDTIYKLYSVNP